MSVTTGAVLHVATLARLRLRADEVERLTGELNDILAHMAELAGAETAEAEPEPATEWPAPLRPDDAPPDVLGLPPERLAPAWEEGFFTVPRLSAMDTPGEAAS